MGLEYVGYIMSNFSLSFDNDGRVYVKAHTKKNILRITMLMFIHILVFCVESPCGLPSECHCVGGIYCPSIQGENKSKMWPLFTDKLISDRDGRDSFQPYQLGIHSKLRLSK
jgi:hypothetical protein